MRRRPRELTKLSRVRSSNTAAVDDTGVLRNCRGDSLDKVGTNVGVRLLCLSGSGDLSGANGPNWLISNNNFAMKRHNGLSLKSMTLQIQGPTSIALRSRSRQRASIGPGPLPPSCWPRALEGSRPHRGWQKDRHRLRPVSSGQQALRSHGRECGAQSDLRRWIF